ncbi:TrmB family transcriptional regulator [Halobacterium yunchengense]|uniref:TrmB family transcriptional regulator n=1 Tax=Halobacterium yunchengense TaxID=3108497 RepID=UPI0030087C95
MADLRDLGLSEYEANAYRSLLRTGPATAKELSEASGVPMGRIYDVLGSIESQHLVRSQTASRPKKYVAVEPDTALDRLLADRKRELREKADQYEAVVDELADDLQTPAQPDEGFWTAALGPGESVDLLLERVDAADDSVRLLAGFASTSFDVDDTTSRVVDHLEDALDRDVAVSVLISRDLAANLPDVVNERYVDVLAEHPNYEVRIGQTVEGNVTIVDDAEVCLDVSNPVDPDESFAMIDLHDAAFAADVTAVFEDTWADAATLD